MRTVPKNRTVAPQADDWDDWVRDRSYSVQAQHRPQTVVVYLRGITRFGAHLAEAHPDVSCTNWRQFG